jgi:aspartate aminotransferase-like enzyme
MKLAVVGSRSFKDNLQARIVAQDIIRNRLFNGKITTIISGGANGPDKWAEEVAKQFNIETIIYKPEWKTYGKSAGMRRNVDIISASDHVLIFWDEKSKGTAHDIKITRKQNKSYELFVWDKSENWRLYESFID